MRIGVGLWPMAHRHCLALLTDSSMKRIWLCEEWLSEVIRTARAHGALNQVRPRQQGDVAVGGGPSAHPLNPAGGPSQTIAEPRALLPSDRQGRRFLASPSLPAAPLFHSASTSLETPAINRPIASRKEATGWVVWGSRRYSGGSPS